jgi:hypothetical protein
LHGARLTRAGRVSAATREGPVPAQRIARRTEQVSADRFEVPEAEKQQTFDAFAAHRDEVTEGYRVAPGA